MLTHCTCRTTLHKRIFTTSVLPLSLCDVVLCGCCSAYWLIEIEYVAGCRRPFSLNWESSSPKMKEELVGWLVIHYLPPSLCYFLLLKFPAFFSRNVHIHISFNSINDTSSKIKIFGITLSFIPIGYSHVSHCCQVFAYYTPSHQLLYMMYNGCRCSPYFQFGFSDAGHF